MLFLTLLWFANIRQSLKQSCMTRSDTPITRRTISFLLSAGIIGNEPRFVCFDYFKYCLRQSYYPTDFVRSHGKHTCFVTALIPGASDSKARKYPRSHLGVFGVYPWRIIIKRKVIVMRMRHKAYAKIVMRVLKIGMFLSSVLLTAWY